MIQNVYMRWCSSSCPRVESELFAVSCLYVYTSYPFLLSSPPPADYCGVHRLDQEVGGWYPSRFRCLRRWTDWFRNVVRLQYCTLEVYPKISNLSFGRFDTLDASAPDLSLKLGSSSRGHVMGAGSDSGVIIGSATKLSLRFCRGERTESMFESGNARSFSGLDSTALVSVSLIP